MSSEFWFKTKQEGLEIDEGYVFDELKFPDFPEMKMPGIVVTPTCEFHQKKAEHAVVLPLVPFSIMVEARIAKKAKVTWNEDEGRLDLREVPPEQRQKKAASVRNLIRQIINGGVPGVHYIPPITADFGHRTAVFDTPMGVKVADLPKTFVAAFRAPYREHLSTRFCAYYLRVGTRDFPTMLDKLFDDFTLRADEIAEAT